MRDMMPMMIAVYGLLFVFYIPFVLLFQKRTALRMARKRFCRGVVSVFQNCADDAQAVPQVLMLYKRLAERYTSLSSLLCSAAEMIEDLLCMMDTSPPHVFKEEHGMDAPIDIRNRMVTLLALVRQQQPFSSISSKEGNLLNMLKQAVESNNRAMALNTLTQLGDEIEVLERGMRRQEGRNRLSFAVSVVGVVLTIFFGAISFVQMIR
jgi:hypothetical protein